MPAHTMYNYAGIAKLFQANGKEYRRSERGVLKERKVAVQTLLHWKLDRRPCRVCELHYYGSR